MLFLPNGPHSQAEGVHLTPSILQSKKPSLIDDGVAFARGRNWKEMENTMRNGYSMHRVANKGRPQRGAGQNGTPILQEERREIRTPAIHPPPALTATERASQPTSTLTAYFPTKTVQTANN